jgi:hypothetical protein
MVHRFKMHDATLEPGFKGVVIKHGRLFQIKAPGNIGSLNGESLDVSVFSLDPK